MKVTQSCPTLCDPMDDTVHGILQARILEWVAFPFSRGIFPTQGSNPGLPHCRRILHQLSHQGRPSICKVSSYRNGKSFPGGARGQSRRWIRSKVREDPLQKGMTTHSSVLAWRIQGTEEPGGLQSTGSPRVRND